MGTRIRYRKSGEAGIIESVKRFPHETNGATYKVQINEPELAYRIIEDTSNTIVASGRAVNLHQVKLKAKATLSGLGIKFDEREARQRKPKTVAVA
jgi:hypothetical protein